MSSDPAEFRHEKPLDFGADGITGSVDAEGRIIALNTYDPAHGYITLTSADPFPEADRFDARKVREYRAGLAALQGFGPTIENLPVKKHLNFFHRDVAVTTMRRFQGEDLKADVTTWAKDGGAVQLWILSEAKARWRGRISLQRCAYTQLTEGGVLPTQPLRLEITFREGTLVIFNPLLGRAAAIAGFESDEPFSLVADEPVELDIPLPDSHIILAYGFGASPDEALAAALALRKIEESLSDIRPNWPDTEGYPEDKLARRGLIYGAQMCVPVGDGLCILTDHMILPLSYNRDAYYVATALLHGAKDGADIMRRHLIWLFEIAQRTDGDWGRCYLANGVAKDPAYQLDQQLYPLLELAEYVAFTGDKTLLERLRPQADSILAGLARRRDPEFVLYATDETPGDEALAQPYHLSAHILLWRMLTRWAAVSGDDSATSLARQVKSAVQQHFVVQDRDDRVLYAYAVDGRGGQRLYIDVSDFPFALAPAWGFCPATLPAWRGTVDFAFSDDNEGSFDGRLGAMHTRAPWAMGDLLEIIVARALKDAGREARAWARLRRGAAIDGALPEAYDATTGAATSRVWFARPNAVAACLQLGVWDAKP